MAKWKNDLADVQAIYEDVLRFSRMTFDEWKTHLEDHPEDRGLYHINLPEGGHLQIGVAATDRFFALTQRLIADAPKNADLHRGTLNSAIRTEFVEMFLRNRREITRSAVDKMLARALKAARQEHRMLTHYLPCLLVHNREPLEFRVGPVRFLHVSKFFADFGEMLDEQQHQSSSERRAKAEAMVASGELDDLMPRSQWQELDRQLLQDVRDYYTPYAWVAEVTVPACDEKMSRVRAELTVQAAIDVLKLLAFDWYFGRRLRLGVDHGVIDKVVDLVRREDGQFEITWKRGGHTALAQDGWFDDVVKDVGGHLHAAGQVIEAYLVPDQPFQIATRWLDALNWYGQAVEERIASAQIVKYVAALERLTITERTPTDGDRGLTEAVTRRAALFAAGSDEEARERRRLEARELYRWRSKLMHGQASPVVKEQLRADQLRSLMASADDLTAHVLIDALGEYVHLLMAEKRTDDDLEERLRVLEAAFASASPGQEAKGENSDGGDPRI